MHNNSLCTAANAEAVLSFLRDRGILEDDGATPQQVEEKKRKQAYHNTLLLLTNYNYDDLFQIGCIGLCKAAATDNGIGCFSTYAYRVIWNEICDALIHATRHISKEASFDEGFLTSIPAKESIPSAESLDLKDCLNRTLKDAPEGTRKGLFAALLMAEGYSSQEAGDMLKMSANVARSLASRARRYLKDSPEYSQLVGGCL